MKKRIVLLMFLLVIMTNVPTVTHAHGIDLDFSELFAHHQSVMMLINADSGAIEHVNQAAADFYGYSITELETMKIQDIVSLSPQEAAAERWRAVADEGNHVILQHRLASGELRTVEVYACPHFYEDRILLFSIVHDITDKVELTAQNKMMTRRFILILAGATLLLGILSFLLFQNYRRLKADRDEISNHNELRKTYINANRSFIYLKDENLRYIFVNNALAEFYHKNITEIIGQDVSSFADGEFAAFSKRTDLDCLEKKKVIVETFKWKDIVLEATKFPVKLLNGRIGVGAYVRDVTEEYNAKRDLLYLSFHDPLTGLYNRRYIETKLEKGASEIVPPFSVIIGDVNGLKLTNDIFGHAAGDLLLQKAAEAMKEGFTKEGAVIARWGGDEFFLLLPKTTDAEAEMIMKKIKSRFALARIKGISGSISLGCDTNTINGEILATIKNAEEKMYEEKTVDRKRFNHDSIQRIIKTLHEKFPREAEHAQRVSKLSVAIGEAMHSSPSELERLKQAGFLHDMGKMVLDELLLGKREPLTVEERQKIKDHPVVGYRIANLADQTLEIAKYILSHHENWDGTGYPKGLRGKAIPKTARIIALADYYDSLVYGASTQKARSQEDVLAEIERNAGQKFDPEIVRVFLAMMKDYRVSLKTGS